MVYQKKIHIIHFFMKDILNVKKHKEQHLSNIQPNISVKKHLSNIHSDNIHTKKVDMCLSI